MNKRKATENHKGMRVDHFKFARCCAITMVDVEHGWTLLLLAYQILFLLDYSIIIIIEIKSN